MIDELASDLIMIETQIEELNTRKKEIRKQIIELDEAADWLLNRVHQTEDEDDDNPMPVFIEGITHKIMLRHNCAKGYKKQYLDAALTPEQQSMFKGETWQQFIRPRLALLIESAAAQAAAHSLKRML